MSSGGKLRGDRVRHFREARGWTLEDLARELQTTVRQVYRYEKEERDFGGEVVTQLARLFETTTDYLLGISDDADPRLIEVDLTDEERELILALRRKQAGRAVQAFAALSKEGE